jgi:flagellar protein FlaF
MYRSPQQAYDQGKKTTDSNRQIEAAALFKAAHRLEACQKAWDSPERRTLLQTALRLNQKLWTIFQSELASPDHDLPADLRRDLLSLSAFVDRRTYDVMASPSPEKLSALIDINRHIASGLTATPA